ncbi:Aim41p NDAI_0E01460 [Naumovozyma dairenensis CBS 421]|uniref:Altered inheritance of mitochondria protein 41 n=1 Tax=Naumovozyma dairenensis (strain ATCC 10597 / BCRC 20456 / CBS 421 / NBRC 0211 / NRRL Y-12639) TaxID=1071378 RepID=G0WB42_NAUDC|nr:hypothetical protein NDAI_0E01460 [Naumovozyma dairenensis CBS 421]CCD24962.1 hypothetical protein NDAI_0E01460 [Naumovozyma dairenensis CBS 421]
MFLRVLRQPAVRRSIIPTSRRFLRFNSTEAYTNAISNLKKDLKEAMSAKDEVKKTTIRSILSTVKNEEIANAKNDSTLNEFSLFDTFSRLITQRMESIENYKKNDRQDLVNNEQKELDILKDYRAKLPVATEDEINAKVLALLNKLKETQEGLKINQVMSKLDWKTIPTEWRASANSIKKSVVSQFKDVFERMK